MRLGFDLSGKRVLVVGLARTGVVTSLFSAGYGATVTATDERPESELAETAAQLRAAGVKLELGGHVDASFLEQDLIVVSPGVPAKLPPLELARARGIPVWSEIELAWRFLRGKLVAITGSNGKTTTTALLAHILQTSNIPTLVGGNIGTPLLALVERSTDPAVTVAEISSFQLETIDKFRPEIGVLLNLTPDHLDRHGTFEEYAHAKMRMFENQLERDMARAERGRSRNHRAHAREAAHFLVQPPETSGQRRIPARQRNHFSQRRLGSGAGATRPDSAARRTQRGKCPGRVRRGISRRRHSGRHRERREIFRGVEHRLEFAGEISGVQFYNDSKATNVDAAVKAIEAFPGPLVVILGGKDKGSPYTPLRDLLHERARLALLIGEAAPKIAADLEGAVEIRQAGTLERAMQLAVEAAQPGDTVLLAPACSSFDQFENYEQRGRVFKELVALRAGQLASGATGAAAAEPSSADKG